MRDIGCGFPELPVYLEQVHMYLEVWFAGHDDDASGEVKLLTLFFGFVGVVVVEAEGVGDDSSFLSVACFT